MSTPPFPPLSGTSDLLFRVEKRQRGAAGFGDGSGRGRPTGENGKSFFFSGAREKVAPQNFAKSSEMFGDEFRPVFPFHALVHSKTCKTHKIVHLPLQTSPPGKNKAYQN